MYHHEPTSHGSDGCLCSCAIFPKCPEVLLQLVHSSNVPLETAKLMRWLGVCWVQAREGEIRWNSDDYSQPAWSEDVDLEVMELACLTVSNCTSCQTITVSQCLPVRKLLIN